MNNKTVTGIIVGLIAMFLVGLFIGRNSPVEKISEKYLVQCYSPHDEVVINTVAKKTRFASIWTITLEDDRNVYFNGICKVNPLK